MSTMHRVPHSGVFQRMEMQPNPVSALSFVSDGRGVLIEVLDAGAVGEDLFLPIDRLCGRPLREGLPPELAQAVLETVQSALSAAAPRCCDALIERAENDLRFTIVAVPQSADRACVVLRRSPARSRSRETLRLQTSALEAAANGILIADIDGRVLWANQAFSGMSGYELAEMLEEEMNLFSTTEMPHEELTALRASLREGKTWRGEVTARRKDGSTYTDETTITPVKASSGSITHFVAIRQDVTEQRFLEDQVVRAQRMESIGRLAGGVAHDFNNVLTAIQGYVALSIASEVPAAVREYLEQIDRAAGRAAELTGQLLAFSRQQIIRPRLLNLDATLSGAVDLLRRLIGEDIELAVEFSVRRGSVLADPGQLEQVLVNLAVNARDAMPDGGRLRISTEAVELDEAFCQQHFPTRPGRYVRLAVSDTGEGMSENTQERIFEPFFSTKPIGKGTGLGLATVYGIVKQAGGSIWVKSVPGAGTSFHIYLPLTEVETGVEEARGAPEATTEGRETLLLVEDEEMVRAITAHLLTGAGYRVVQASSGIEALSILEEAAEGGIDLLITDVVMPGMGGRELWERTRTLRPELKALFMSGYTDDVVVRDGLLAADVGFLQKPFRRVELLRSVRRAIDG